MGLLNALARAAVRAPTEFVDSYKHLRSPGPYSLPHAKPEAIRLAAGDAGNAALDELLNGPAVLQKALPNKATLRMRSDASFPWSPMDVSWYWDDIGFQSALGGRSGNRTRRQVAETMQAALKQTGKRALTTFPREYSVGGLTMAHDRLYRRNAARLAPFYKMDENAVLVPTPLAYAQYAGRRGLQGAGIGGLAAIMAPEDAY